MKLYELSVGIMALIAFLVAGPLTHDRKIEECPVELEKVQEYPAVYECPVELEEVQEHTVDLEKV